MSFTNYSTPSPRLTIGSKSICSRTQTKICRLALFSSRLPDIYFRSSSRGKHAHHKSTKNNITNHSSPVVPTLFRTHSPIAHSNSLATLLASSPKCWHLLILTTDYASIVTFAEQKLKVVRSS